MTTKKAAWFGFDASTTAISAGVRDAEGNEGFASVPIEGATRWKHEPAFDLYPTPFLMLRVLQQLQEQGWDFSAGGSVSWAVRQHDMVLLGKDRWPLIPALSWQCNAATAEVETLIEQGAEEIVGPLAPRMILPKLMWAKKKQPSLVQDLRWVMTTGDLITSMLCDGTCLSTSDAVSNGLLGQGSKNLAVGVLDRAGFLRRWFPKVVASGSMIGSIKPFGADSAPWHGWRELREMLSDWKIFAGLGDNHATGVGCGLADYQTIVVSAGTSGTINRICSTDPSVKLSGKALAFEFYDDRLLLMMLADCGAWYKRFMQAHRTDMPGQGDIYACLNEWAGNVDPGLLEYILHDPGASPENRETYPAGWPTQEMPFKVACTQYSIMLELLRHVYQMLREVSGRSDHQITRYVLTGGLSQSRFFQEVFKAGISLIAPAAEVLISSRQGPLAYQTAAFGALMNAMLDGDLKCLPELAEKLCPLRAITDSSGERKGKLQKVLKRDGITKT